MNKESHGLKVAQLAGMPPSAVTVAHEAISRLESEVWIPSLDGHALKALGEVLTSDVDTLAPFPNSEQQNVR